jgi:hypothetical protein
LASADVEISEHALRAEAGVAATAARSAAASAAACFAVAGLESSAATSLPKGLDFCAFSPTLIAARDSGLANYVPSQLTGAVTSLAVETPVYRGGVVPPTLAGRRRTFIGWLGELSR